MVNAKTLGVSGFCLFLLLASGCTDSNNSSTLQEGRGEVPAELDRLLSDVDRFWEEVAADVDLEYEAFDRNRLFLRSWLDEGFFAGCEFDGDVEELTAESVADNAYVALCDEGITLVLDDVGYLPDLEEKYGSVGTSVLIAHEWGHIVQNQLGLYEQTAILAEQQADCYSGAYIAWAESNKTAPFDQPEALDAAILSTIEARDEVGVGADDVDAHGNGFDRVRATQEGYDRGVTFCAGYDQTPPPVTQFEFTDGEDESNQGNLEFSEADALLQAEVRQFFGSVAEQADLSGVAESEESVSGEEAIDALVVQPEEEFLRELYEAVGDNAVGTEYARRYARAVQEIYGDPTDGEGPVLQRACLVGSWLHWIINDSSTDTSGLSVGEPPAALSPGDLDETLLTYVFSEELDDHAGLVFELVASLRVGTFECVDACALGR